MAQYTVVFNVKNLKDGGAGKITINVHPDWAPLGAKCAAPVRPPRACIFIL